MPSSCWSGHGPYAVVKLVEGMEGPCAVIIVVEDMGGHMLPSSC